MIPTAFTKTLRALQGSLLKGTLITLMCSGATLGGILYWACRVPVGVLATSADARIEIASSATTVQSPLSGKVVRVDLELGRAVTPGDVLVELDAVPEALQAAQETTRAAGLEPEIARLGAALQAEQRATVESQRAFLAAVTEARMQARGADEAVALAAADAARSDRLLRAGLIAASEAERSQSAARRLTAVAAAAEATIERLVGEQRTSELRRAATVAELASRIARLEGERAAAAATARRLDHDVARRVIRATVNGRIGDAAPLRPGAVVLEGARIAAIVPEGALRIVAHFSAAAAYGRLRRDQPARFRLSAFPWAEFGVVEARVREVGSEEQDGRVRAELDILPSPSLMAPLRHGMPGELDVEIEHITPLALLLRTTGAWLTTAAR